ncbi:MAG: hypothetical protein DRP84_10145 [Spirochaetes bacterium]|nr:MAG: hypothetical protein DRP84_10145 [Spirochaetota bacterium]
MKNIEKVRAKKIIEDIKETNIRDINTGRWSKTLIKLVRDQLYSEKTHFILELIQNADDCRSNELFFNLRGKKLIVKNDGFPFRKIDVEALSDFGKSTKEPGDIGFFGIGFKSVFLITDKPEIYSNNYSFYYDSEYMIVPHWIDNIPKYVSKELENLKGKGSVFVFPIKDDESHLRIKKQLKRITGDVLLYLNHLKVISVNGKNHHIKKTKVKNCFEIIGPDKKPKFWKKYSISFKIPKREREILGKDRGIKDIEKKIKEREKIVVTFRTNKNNKILTQEGRLYAFLPTHVKTGFKFNIQADFSVNLERTVLRATGAKWNNWILSNVHKVISQIIEDYKKQKKGIRTEFYKLLPLDDSEIPEDLSAVKKNIDNYIKNTNSILVKVPKSKRNPEGKKWIKPKFALLADPKIQKLLDEKDIEHLYNKRVYYVADDEISREGIRYIKEIVDEVSIDDIFNLLEDSKWIRKRKDIKWFGELFIYFAEYMENLSYWDKEQFKDRINSKCIPTDKGIILNKSKFGIFRLPEEELSIKTSEFRDRYLLVNNELIEYLKAKNIRDTKEKERREKGLNLLKEIIPELSPEIIIKNIINETFYGDNWKKYSDSTLTRYINFVKKYEEYWDTAKIKIKAKCRGRKRIYKEPSELYLPKCYGNKYDVDIFFRGYDGCLVSSYYIKKELKSKRTSSRDRIRRWRKFLLSIGVKECPLPKEKIEKVSDFWEIRKKLKKYHPQAKVERSTWGYNVRDYDFDENVKRVILDCINDKVENSSKRLKILFEILNDNWSEIKNFMKSEYQYHYHGWKPYKSLGKSSFAEFLASNWLPTKDGEHLKPEVVAISEIKDMIPYDIPILDGKITNPEFKNYLETLGLQTKPSIDGALESLKNYIKEGNDDIDNFRKIYHYLQGFFVDPNQDANDKERIKNELISIPWIYTPNYRNKYRKISEVFWGRGALLMEWIVGIEDMYSEFKNLFVEIFGIKKNLAIDDYIKFLTDNLWTKNDLTREEIASLKTIYKELNHALDPDSGIDIKNQSIWRNIKDEFKVWCEDEYWRSVKERIYYNDNENLHKIFSKNKRLNFIFVPDNTEFKFLFKELGIKSISESAREICYPSGEEIDMTAQYQNEIKKLVPYIALFIEDKSSEKFDRLKDKEVFSALMKIEVKFVDSIDVRVSVGDVVLPLGNREYFYSLDDKGNCIYLTNTLKDDPCLFVYISRAINDVIKISGLEDFICKIYELEDSKIKSFLQARGIDISRQSIIEKILHIEKISVTPTKKPIDADYEKTIKEDHVPEQVDTPFEIPTLLQQEPAKPLDLSSEDEDWYPEYPADEVDISDIDIESYTPDKKVEKKDTKIYTPLKEKPSLGLSELSKRRIGREGEKLVFRHIKRKMKEKYSDANFVETKEGFKVEKDGNIVVEVIWLNKNVESGEPYDIIIIENGKEYFIEVKSTKDDKKSFFEVSREQWKRMKEKGNNFYIYRVYSIGAEKPKIEEIPDPVKLWKEDKIEAYPIRIKI